MARFHGRQTIGKHLHQWTQHQCDVCQTLDPKTTQGHETGIMAAPFGWEHRVIDGVLRLFCPICREAA